MRGGWSFAKSAQLLAVVLLLAAHATGTDLEGFDDEDEEQLAVHEQTFPPESFVEVAQDTAATVSSSDGDLIDEGLLQNQTAPGGNQTSYSAFRKPQSFQDVQMEICFALVLIVYCVNVWLGRRTNSDIALAWAGSFCGDGGVLDRNFAQIGIGGQEGNAILERVSNSDFKLYATGRRFCTHLSATLSLRKRQDLLSLAWYCVQQRPDILDMEVAMSEGAMPPMVPSHLGPIPYHSFSHRAY